MSDAYAKAPTDRRDFLLTLGAGAGVAAIAVQTAASLGRWCQMSPTTRRRR